MATPFYARNKNTVKTLDCKRRISSKKSWESDDDNLGVILIDYLQTGKLLEKLNAEFAEKRPHLLKKRFCFTKTIRRLTPQRLLWRKSRNYGLNCLVTILIHEIWPQATFFLFPNLKIAFGGQKFSSNEKAITFVNNYFTETPSSIWRS